jgi:gas vesicle protein
MSSKRGNTFIAFLAGACVGGIAGILFAPDKGVNTRNKLSFQLDKYRNKLEELLKDLDNTEKNLPSEAKSRGEKVITDAKVKAEKLLDDVDELIGQIKKQ